MVGAGFALLSYEKQAKGIVFGAQDYLASGQLEPGFRTGSSTGSEPTLAISKPLDDQRRSCARCIDPEARIDLRKVVQVLLAPTFRIS
jgi:hypothetical protein